MHRGMHRPRAAANDGVVIKWIGYLAAWEAHDLVPVMKAIKECMLFRPGMVFGSNPAT